MKKILVILACVAMLFSFASCNDGSSSVASGTLAESYIAGYALKDVLGDTAISTASTGFAAKVNAAAATAKTISNTSITVEVDAESMLDTVVGNGGDLAGYIVDSADFTVTITKEAGTTEKPVTAISDGNLNGTIVLVSPDFQKDYTIAVSGGLDVEGTFTPVAPTAPETKWTATLDVQSMSLKQDYSVTVNNNGTDKETVSTLAGITTSQEKFEAYAKALIASINEKLKTATASSVSKNTTSNDVEVKLTGVTGVEGDTTVTIVVSSIATEETAESSGKYAVTTGAVSITAKMDADTAITFGDIELVGKIEADNTAKTEANYTAADAEAGLQLTIGTVSAAGYTYTAAN